jgi:hypothetical protein
MPYTFFGIGTQFIGKRDFGTDGSFVTTEFKTATLPLYPINTFRVIEGKSSTEYHVISSTRSTEYSVLALGKVNIRQAAYVYGYAALHVAYIISLAFIGPKWLTAETSIANPMWILQFAMFMLPVAIPLTMRMMARRHSSVSVISSCPCGSGLQFKSCCFAYSQALKDRERNFYKTFT